MRAIDVRHMGREKVICAWVVDDVIVDPGPQSTEETLLAELGDFVPRALLLTHIHFDHAGATGSLLRRWPGIPVYVHERGAPHIANPEKLVASAGRLYGGEEGLRRLWGEVVPVPEANLRVLSGGERDVEGAFRVEYTPGHASRCMFYLHEPSGWAFVGDTAGVRVPQYEFTLSPTPPPKIDVAAWERSLDVIAGWRPEGLGLTHFGPVEDPLEQVERLRIQLHRQIELAAGEDPDAFAAALSEQARAEAGEE